MSSSDAIAVSSVANSLPKAASLPTTAQVPTPVETPNVTPQGVNQDAVAIDVSAETPQLERQDAQSAGNSSKTPSTELRSLEDATRLAENIQKALNDINGTKVSFDVSIQAEGRSSLSFQVIDSDSGEVIREFPPEIFEYLSHRADLAEGKGLLVEDLA